MKLLIRKKEQLPSPPFSSRFHPFYGVLGRLAGVSFMVIIFFNVVGVPYLRTQYEYRGNESYKVIISATYWNPANSFIATPYDLGRESCPLVILMPLEMSLWEQVQSIWRIFY